MGAHHSSLRIVLAYFYLGQICMTLGSWMPTIVRSHKGFDLAGGLFLYLFIRFMITDCVLLHNSLLTCIISLTCSCCFLCLDSITTYGSPKYIFRRGKVGPRLSCTSARIAICVRRDNVVHVVM
jgi:hypothetical protein